MFLELVGGVDAALQWLEPHPAGAGASSWFLYISRRYGDIGIQNLAIGRTIDGMHLACGQPISVAHARRKGADARFLGAQVGGKDTLTKLRADAHPPPCRTEDRRPRMKSPRPARAISSDASPAPLNLACESRRAPLELRILRPLRLCSSFPPLQLPFVVTLPPNRFSSSPARTALSSAPPRAS